MSEALKSQTNDDLLARSRRRQIFEAASRVLARKSFHEATVKEIAVEAGIAAGSIYVYLQSKEEILLLMAECVVGELIEALPGIRARTRNDPRAELLEVLRAQLEINDRYREAASILNHEVRYLARRPQYRAALKPLLHAYKAAVVEPLERGRARGVIRFESIESAVEALHMLCAGWAMGRGGLLARVDKETYWREIVAIVEGRFFGSSERVDAVKEEGE